MKPPAHFLVAALPVVAYTLARYRRPPSPRLWFVVLVGSQFPDLIDKPLAHQFFLIPSGRVLAHSLVVAVPVLVALLLFARHRDRTEEVAVFGFAYLSHLLADFYKLLLRPGSRFPNELFWPILPVPPGPLEPRWAGPNSINVKLWTLFSAALLLTAAYLVARDLRGGTPPPG